MAVLDLLDDLRQCVIDYYQIDLAQYMVEERVTRCDAPSNEPEQGDPF